MPCVFILPDNINGLAVQSEVMIIHIRSLAKSRLTSFVGKAAAEELQLAKQTIQDLL